MTALYLDEGVSVYLAPRLSANGHPARTTEAEGLRRNPDAAQLLHAVKSGSVLVTHDRGDFVALHFGWLLWTREWNVERPHAGILIIPQAHRNLSEDHLALAITGFLNHQPPLVNECYEWRPDRDVWQRYSLPDSR